MRHWRLILLVLGLIGVGYLLHRYVPPQHNPWRAPDLTEPIGLATYNKLTDLKHVPRGFHSSRVSIFFVTTVWG